MGLAAILLTPYWLIQGIRHGKYLSNLSERLGISFPALEKLPAGRMDAILLHAGSVGGVVGGGAPAQEAEGGVFERAPRDFRGCHSRREAGEGGGRQYP